MPLNIPESDWRRFKEIHPRLLELYCSRILHELTVASERPGSSAHERYVKVYKLIEDRDKQLARAFNDFRRSTAIMQMGIMLRMKLLTDEDLRLFSEQTQTQVEGIASL